MKNILATEAEIYLAFVNVLKHVPAEVTTGQTLEEHLYNLYIA
jgi:hypothetical protein